MEIKEALEAATTTTSCDIDQIREHITCKARRLLNEIAPSKPTKLILQTRKQQGLNDLTLKHLDRNELSNGDILKTVSRVFSGMNYEGMDKDMEAITTSYINFSNLLLDGEYTLTGSIQPIEHTYHRVIVKSRIDCTVKSGKDGRIYPVVVDFSKTQYDVGYNPVAYHAQTVVDHLDLCGLDNTEVLILSVGSAKQWIYNRRKYSALIHDSIMESVYEIKHDFNACRFGWWCTSCHWRGICHSLIRDFKKKGK